MIDMTTLQARLDPLLPGLLGVKLTTFTPDKVVGTMLVRPEMCTAGETLHGGAFMAFADTLGAMATVANLPEGYRTVTLESKTNFLGGAAVNTVVTGESLAFHKGRTTQVWQTKITNADGRLCAVVTQTQMVMPIGR